MRQLIQPSDASWDSLKTLVGRVPCPPANFHRSEFAKRPCAPRMRKRRQQLAARAEESADNLVVGGTAGGSQDARGDAGHGVFLLPALPLGGLRLALSLVLCHPCLAFRFPFSHPRLAFRFLFRGLLLTLGFLLGRLLRLFLLLGKLRLLRLKLSPLCRESAIDRFR